MPQTALKRINMSRTHVPDEEEGSDKPSESAIWAGFYCYFIFPHMLDLCPVKKKKKSQKYHNPLLFRSNVGQVRLYSELIINLILLKLHSSTTSTTSALSDR